MTWRDSVVLPDDSGPKISTTRPRGMPPMPSAASTAREPVGMTAMATSGRSPSRMIEPLPNWRSICVSAVSTARHFSLGFTLDMSSPFSMGKVPRVLRDYRLRGQAPQDAMRTEGSSLRHDPVSMSEARRAFAANPLAAFLATGFGSGLSPVMPGTAGSLVGLVLGAILVRALAPHTGSLGLALGLLTSGLVFGAVGVAVSGPVCRALDAKDPGCVVI